MITPVGAPPGRPGRGGEEQRAGPRWGTRPLFFFILAGGQPPGQNPSGRPPQARDSYHPGARLKPQCHPLSGRWKGKA